DLSSKSTLHWERFGKSTQEGYPIKASLTEKTLPAVPPLVLARRGLRPPTAGGALLELKGTDFTLDLAALGDQDQPNQDPDPDGKPSELDDLRLILRAVLAPLTNQMKTVTNVASVGRDGVLHDPKSIIPPAAAAVSVLPKFNTQIMQSLTALSFPLPNKEV